MTAAPFSGAAYNGTYSGQWNNATFSSTGAAKIIVAANDATKSGNVRWDFDGNVLGQGNPAEENFDVTYSDDGLTFGGLFITRGPDDMVEAWEFKKLIELSPKKKATKITPGEN